MPQHWVGRSASPPRWAPVAAVLLAVVVAAGLFQLPANRVSAETGAQAALGEFERSHADDGHGHVADGAPVLARFGGSGDWETGTITVPGEDPRVYLYVAKRLDNGEWQVALEGSTDFPLLAEQGRMALSGTASADLLATTTTAATGGSAQLSLPWRKGTSWRLTGGPHHHSGGSRPWSSLDFAGPRPGMSVKVRAARGGIVTRPCRNLVQVRHAGGWTTSYYHLKRIKVRSGQRVDRGDVLGFTSTRARCGGRATGPHVHFTLMRYGSLVNIRGHAIGGWTVREGSSQYSGCLVKASSERCAPSRPIYNTGAIGG